MTDRSTIPDPKYLVGDILKALVYNKLKDETIENGIAVTTVIQADYLPSVGWVYYFARNSTPVAEVNLKGSEVLKKSTLKFPRGNS